MKAILLAALCLTFLVMARGNSSQASGNPPVAGANSAITDVPRFGSLFLDCSHMDNIQSLFFLHSSDSLNLSLVSHILTHNNYNTWSRAMTMALNAKNKLVFVNGSLPQPLSNDPTAGI